jgi:hypothetical protein
MTRDEAIAKCRALHTLAAGTTNEHEAKAARGAAKALIAKHGIKSLPKDKPVKTAKPKSVFVSNAQLRVFRAFDGRAMVTDALLKRMRIRKGTLHTMVGRQWIAWRTDYIFSLIPVRNGIVLTPAGQELAASLRYVRTGRK